MGLSSALTATVTATSADGGCDGRVVRVVVVRAERVAQAIDGLALEAEPDVGIDAGGDADVGVAEEFFDHDEVDTLFQEQGRDQVPEIVQPDVGKAVAGASEWPGNKGRAWTRSESRQPVITGRRSGDQALLKEPFS